MNMSKFELTTERPVSFRQILGAPNAPELFKEYASECALPELGEINPQAQIYEALETSGGMQAFGVYDRETLVGFAVVLIYVVPHYGKKIATTESIFLASSHRNEGNGSRLMKVIEDHARKRGCTAFLYSAPTGSRFVRLLSALKKYRHSNSVFLRSL